MAHRPALQVMPSYTQEDLLKETGRLLQQSKQLREQVCDHWQIEDDKWKKSLADSEDAVRHYTRWTVTGRAMEQMAGRGNSGENQWKEAKQVPSPTNTCQTHHIFLTTPCSHACTCA